MDTETKTQKPLVCHTVPFVRVKQADTLPFVGCNTPIVLSKGFTLIELIVTLVVAGILAALAVPAFNDFINANRLSTTTNNLIADLQFARSEAIKRGKQVVICPSTDGATCTGGVNLTGGWMIFRDLNDDSAWTSPGDERIRVQERAPSGTTIAGPASVAAVVYSREGLLASNVAEYTVCSTGLAKGRAIELAATGRPSFKEKDC